MNFEVIEVRKLYEDVHIFLKKLRNSYGQFMHK